MEAARLKSVLDSRFPPVGLPAASDRLDEVPFDKIVIEPI